MKCVKEQRYCKFYLALSISCKRISLRDPNFLNLINWKCTSIFSGNYSPFKLEIYEMQINCEQFKDPNIDNPRIVVNGSCYLQYSLRKVDTFTDFDKYLVAKAIAYCLFSIIFFLICCAIGLKNKRAQDIAEANEQNQLVNVFCNPTFVGQNRTNLNGNEIEDLPPLYSDLFGNSDEHTNENDKEVNLETANETSQIKNIENVPNVQNVQKIQNESENVLNSLNKTSN